MKMYKCYNIKNITNILIFIVSLFILLIFSKNNFESVKSSVTIFISSIIPSLFPFIFFTEFILNTDILKTVQNYTGGLFSKFFHSSRKSSPAIITGFLCGFPMGSKTVSKLYQKGDISHDEARKLLLFINNCNPAFILSTIGIGVFYNIKVGILLAISHYVSSIIIGMFFCKRNSLSIIHENKQKLNTFDKINSIKDKNTFEIIKKCIKNTFVTLSMILGFMILFNLLSRVITTILLVINVNKETLAIISGLFEVTSGINNIYNLHISVDIKLIITSFMLGFSGLCIISQIYSTISGNNFSFKELLMSKLLHGIFSMAITYILLKYTSILDLSAISVYGSVDESIRTEYMYNMKISYLISTISIIFIIFIYYLTRKK